MRVDGAGQLVEVLAANGGHAQASKQLVPLSQLRCLLSLRAGDGCDGKEMTGGHGNNGVVLELARTAAVEGNRIVAPAGHMSLAVAGTAVITGRTGSASLGPLVMNINQLHEESLYVRDHGRLLADHGRLLAEAGRRTLPAGGASSRACCCPPPARCAGARRTSPASTAPRSSSASPCSPRTSSAGP
ncbi:hypothetical protein [Streptomyces sp. NPDC029674]|uniref:hypothetical protein n=1 Tax=Streptomyces sp. NPDC029674 TaxID=3365297 RepID=UPI0038515B82